MTGVLIKYKWYKTENRPLNIIGSKTNFGIDFAFAFCLVLWRSLYLVALRKVRGVDKETVVIEIRL